MLLDAVPDNKIPAVRDLLETIVDPLSRAMANAQQDREPISEEPSCGPGADPAPHADGESILHEAILKEFGISVRRIGSRWAALAFEAATPKP
jgi:hypothetical protein